MERAVRSAGARQAGTELAPDSLVSLTLRPGTRVDGAVTVRGFLVGPQGGDAAATTRALEWPVQAHAGGTLTVEGSAAELLGAQEGVYTLVLFVARQDDPPPAADEVRRCAEQPPAEPTGRWFVRTVHLVPE